MRELTEKKKEIALSSTEETALRRPAVAVFTLASVPESLWYLFKQSPQDAVPPACLTPQKPPFLTQSQVQQLLRTPLTKSCCLGMQRKGERSTADYGHRFPSPNQKAQQVLTPEDVRLIGELIENALTGNFARCLVALQGALVCDVARLGHLVCVISPTLKSPQRNDWGR
ncbi:hypothetical protein GW7_02798 [Heterocephalus glaber]|uniref:Uncharacterized protein n=1 Tax=Heterocephalus glaber TaxID=10181 RepID=G5C0Y6_HETGA|nr:hypothetical protein GW7_02798 [Heterocephalus glaber]